MPNEENLDHLKEDAIRQAREMQSRAQPMLRQDRRPRGTPQARQQPRREPPRPPEPPVLEEPGPRPEPEPSPPPESPLAALFRDKERTIILALLLLLSDGENNHELVFALLYLLM